MKPVSERKFEGSQGAFNENWRLRKEAFYNHWNAGRPRNQIQLAFSNHWNLFCELMNPITRGNCLEVGCGRGTISSHFAENGFNCTLLDSSHSVLALARDIFSKNNHNAKYVCADVKKLPFSNNEFDVVVSIGLMEHFEDINGFFLEQMRVLKYGGTMLCYIVPKNSDNLQKYFNWINKSLETIFGWFGFIEEKARKSELFISTYDSKDYVDTIPEKYLNGLETFGMYPLPMISNSPQFPFTLLPARMERILVKVFLVVLSIRKMMWKRNPWICREKFGQGFLLKLVKDDIPMKSEVSA